MSKMDLQKRTGRAVRRTAAPRGRSRPAGATPAVPPGALGWDDLRTVLAIARAGGLSGAARSLGVQHSTVYRRLEQLERTIGVRLFERDRLGYQINPHGEAVVAAATAMEEAALGAERRVLGADAKPSGTVRIATSEALAGWLLVRLLPPFLARYPEIEIEVDVSVRQVDLTRRDADLALRATTSPPDTLVGRKLATLHYAVYAAPALVAQHGGSARRAPALDTLPWIGYDERVGHLQIARWREQALPQVRPRVRVDSLVTMLQLAVAGLGAIAFPAFVGAQERGLVRITAPLPAPTMDLWLLHHPDLRSNARVRALSQYLAEAVPAELERIERDGPKCTQLAACPLAAKGKRTRAASRPARSSPRS